jgi:hypothetical protein
MLPFAWWRLLVHRRPRGRHGLMGIAEPKELVAIA